MFFNLSIPVFYMNESVSRFISDGEEGQYTGKKNGACCMAAVVLQQSLNKSLSFQDSPTGGTSFVNIYQNVRLDP